MAVIQISKIQVRRGLEENLPQLASGELGWSVDTQKLYIGNGTLTEGAPEIGNTEILTSGADFTNLLDAIKSRFAGSQSGYTSRTGTSLLSPVDRSLQQKLDDVIDLRDFVRPEDTLGGDFTVAIQRAIDQIWAFPDYISTIGVRRKLHIPGGVWPISANLRIPPYATIVGDGPDSSIIRLTAGNVGPMLRLKDSRGNVGIDVNSITSTPPAQISFEGIQLDCEADYDIVTLESTNSVHFTRVKFKGADSTPVTVGNQRAAANISNVTVNTHSITFNECEFRDINYGIYIQGDVESISVNNSRFDSLYQGIRTSSKGVSPQGIRVLNSYFDNIAAEAVFSANASSVITAFNYYAANVAYGNAVAMVSATPTTTILSWNTANNSSIGEVFARTNTAQLTQPLIKIITPGQAAAETQATTMGAVQDAPGATQTLADNTSTVTSLVVFNTTPASIIDYRIQRSSDYRIGTIKATRNGSTIIYDDEFTESANIGVVLNFISNASSATLRANLSSTGTSANIKYTVRSFV